MTVSTGAIVGEQRYYAFGETRLTTGSMFTDKLFTGQREMADLGIYHYGARFYSPKLGRFLSADTIVPNPANPQDFNRYSYVRNNPIRYIDPTGHVCSDPDDPNPTCDGSFLQTTKVGNKMVKGTGLDAGKPKVKKPKPSNGGGTTTTPTVIPTTTPTFTPTTTPTLVPTITPDAGIPDLLPTQTSEHSPATETSLGSPACPECVLAGTVIVLTLLIPEAVIGIGFVINPADPAMNVLDPWFVVLEVPMLYFSWLGLQLYGQGQNRSREDVQVDWNPLHVSNPDIYK